MFKCPVPKRETSFQTNKFIVISTLCGWERLSWAQSFPHSEFIGISTLWGREKSCQVQPSPHSEMLLPFYTLYHSILQSGLSDNLATVRPVLSGHSKRRPKMVFKPDYRLMQIKSIAECSKIAFCNTFHLHCATICL